MRVSAAAALAVVLAAVAASLQGCKKKHHGGSPTPAPPTTTTTTTTSAAAPPPVPPAPEPKPLLPLRAVCYQATPGKERARQLPGLDMMQEGYSNQWGPDGRDDLGMVSTLGGNAVRVYHGFGVEAQTDHGKFLDRAQELGLSVLVGFHTQNVCPDFDCFSAWRDAAAAGFKAGFVKENRWHPAVRMIVLMDRPDVLGLFSEATCTQTDGAKCRVRAALSAMDGFLSAEAAAGLNGSNVSLTIAWSFAVRDSIDGKVQAGIGTYGFQDMKAGVADPSLASYTPRLSQKSLAATFDDRWVHSVNAPSPWSFIKQKVAGQYAQFEPKRWFIAEFMPAPDSQDITQDLLAMDEEARKKGPFMGISFSGFQKDYQMDAPSDIGAFGLGNATFGECSPCQEDVRTKAKQCAEFPVHCLDAEAGKHAEDVAAAWGGSTKAHGMCLKADGFLMF